MRILKIFLLIVIFVSCTGEKDKIKEAVIRYNRALIEAYLRGNASLLKPYTGSSEENRVEQYILFLLKKNQVIKCNLRNMKFTNIKTDSKRHYVETEEEWNFEYLDAKTRARVTDTKIIRYKGKYNMEKRDSDWIVSLLEVEEIG